VWWALDEDQTSLDLQKAPALWTALGTISETVRELISDVIYGGDAVWGEYQTTQEPDADQVVKEVLEYNMTSPGGWSLGEIADDLQDRLDISQSDALDIARNETASTLNVARADAWEEYARETGSETDEVLYDWIGPTDHRTTPICRETEQEIQRRGGAVPLSELKGILREKAEQYADDGGTPERVDEFHPHFNCRRTFSVRTQVL